METLILTQTVDVSWYSFWSVVTFAPVTGCLTYVTPRVSSGSVGLTPDSPDVSSCYKILSSNCTDALDLTPIILSPTRTPTSTAVWTSGLPVFDG